jgi:hypothetical protein
MWYSQNLNLKQFNMERLKIISPGKTSEKIHGIAVFAVFPIIGVPKKSFETFLELLEARAQEEDVMITIITNRTDELTSSTEEKVRAHHVENFAWLAEQHRMLIRDGVIAVGFPEPLESDNDLVDKSGYGMYAKHILSQTLPLVFHLGTRLAVYKDENYKLDRFFEAELEYHKDDDIRVHSTLDDFVEAVVELVKGQLLRLKLREGARMIQGTSIPESYID